MESHYDIVFLSELLKKSRVSPHPDYVAALDYIYNRIENVDASSPSSEFNLKLRILRILLPRFLLPKLLYRLRYDAMMIFDNDKNKREIHGMVSFQKHPHKNMIGMFDIYFSPVHRQKSVVGNFRNIATLIYQLSQRLNHSGYRYIQCGSNQTTTNLLHLYGKIGLRENWETWVDMEHNRIMLKH